MSSLKLAFSIFSAALLVLSGCANFAAAANSFTYVSPGPEHAGKFVGDVPLNRIGNLLLPKGLASFSEDELTIRAVPQWFFDRNIVLKGVIVRAEAVPQKDGFILGGLVLMLDGLWLSSLCRTAAAESIDTMDGASWRGHIAGRVGDSLTFQHDDGKTENIAFSKIKTINSARAFTFNISADNVKISPADSSLSFEARELLIKTRRARTTLWAHEQTPKSNLPGTEAGISKTALAVFVGLDIISTIASPIAIPLVLNARNTRAAKNRIAKTEFESFSQALQSSNSSSSSGSSSTGM